MAETQGTRNEQDAPSASEGDLTPGAGASAGAASQPTAPVITPGEAAGRGQTGLEPLAQGETQKDEVDQSKGIFPAGVPHPAGAPVRPPGELGGGPYEESGRGGVAVSVDQPRAGPDVAGASVEGAEVVIVERDTAVVDAGATGAGGAEVHDAGVTAAQLMDERSISTLNDLIHLDLDAVQAYRHAIDACEIAEIRDNLTEFMGDHERHVRDLREAVRGLGGEPASGRDVKGFFIEGFTAILSQGDRSALLAMRGNEELTNRRYDAARNADLPDSCRPLIERNCEDEARHLAWIKEAIASRAWDTDADTRKAA